MDHGLVARLPDQNDFCKYVRHLMYVRIRLHQDHTLLRLNVLVVRTMRC